MKTMEDLKKSLYENKDAVVIIGSQTGNDPLSKLTEDERETLSKFHTSKTFRRRIKTYWKNYDEMLLPKIKEGFTKGNEVFDLIVPLIQKGLIKRVYYQDIDGQVKEDNICKDIKGAINKFICSNRRCLKKYSFEEMPEDRKCIECESDIRPTFIFVGDNYDADIENQFVDDLNNTHNVIVIGLDLSEDYIIDLVEAFDEKRIQEEEMEIKNIVAIHNEDEEEVDYNDIFLCDFQALGDLVDSTERLVKAII